MTYDKFFTTGTDGRNPYPYQCRLACGEKKEGDLADTWLSRGSECQSKLIEIPTGLGKTAAVVFAWLWNRVFQPDAVARKKWPRRLVYCLPMRTLVEQTRDNVQQWLRRLAEAFPNDDIAWLAKNSPVILMGGEEADPDLEQWDIWPEKPAIVIGTQDMLISRALNRGYGMSRYRWPMHYALLNNDALWVLDEVQLMGVSVETSAQLDGFRNYEEWVTTSPVATWWMSATLDESRLATIDHPVPADGWRRICLNEAERSEGEVRQRYEAVKPVVRADLSLSTATKKDYAKRLAALVAEKHQPGSLTLVVLNRVARAREVYAALKNKSLKLKAANIALVHSRFRPIDRARHASLLFRGGDRIVVATQAVEAGVDVSARLLITELAPWSSMVQRIGRCNRHGELSDAEIQWIDIEPKDEKDELILPYEHRGLSKARSALLGMTSAGPRSLAGVDVEESPTVRPILRRRDLIDLFDTTPDICGQDLDVSRYIRDGEDSDVQLFWRVVEGSAPGAEQAPASRAELCRVAVGEASKFLKKARAWRWNPLDQEWQATDRALPGATFLIDVESGGYDDRMGWTGDPTDRPTVHAPADGQMDGYGKDRASYSCRWQSIADHTNDVIQAMTKLCAELCVDSDLAATLRTAALWHDVGKAHEYFQALLRGGTENPPDESTMYAKSSNRSNSSSCSVERSGFRHELASALAWLLASPPDAPERDLVTYIIAAHHGKVRLSIRALPEEKGPPGDSDRLFARGIWDGDSLCAVPLPGLTTPPVTLDLRFMQMGEGEHGASWLARMIALRDRLGPFRLAYLESLLRAADARGSRSANA